MAAEETVRKMRRFLKLKRREHKRSKRNINEGLNFDMKSDDNNSPPLLHKSSNKSTFKNILIIIL